MQVCGKLYVVATPIGNLQDISQRALDILRTADCVAAEDTRHSGQLLKHFSIKNEMISLHSHNEAARTEKILHLLQQGKSIALISDAGTPLISDPGCYLTNAVHREGFAVIPIPGPCALTAALSASGLSAKHFIFEGFLPVKQKARCQRLSALAEAEYTLVFYEAPHRILDTVRDLQEILGENRLAVIARELTKRYETIHRSTLRALEAWLVSDDNQQRGEFVILVEGSQVAPNQKPGMDPEAVLTILLKQLPVKQAAQLAAEITGEKKNALYRLALEKKQ